MKPFIWLRNYLFGARTIAVGHCFTRKGAAVLLILGRKRAGLTPDGARKIAEQLQAWADHAESMENSITAMRWIVKVSATPESVISREWVSAGIAKTAEAMTNHSEQSREPDRD